MRCGLAGSRRHSSTLRSTTTAPASAPSRDRCSMGRMSTTSAPVASSSPSAAGDTRSSVERASSRSSSMVRGFMGRIVARVRFGRLRTIVLIDDAADIRRLVRSRLRLSKTFDVVGEGTNGVDAVALAAEHRPDLMLLDISMAGMDGLEAIPMVLTASPRTRVVMYSGFDRHGLAETSASLGASDFIPKSDPIADLPRRLLAVFGDDVSTIDEAPPPEPGDEALLAEHEERFRTAFDQAAIGMATLSLAGRVVRANDALGRTVRTPADDLVGVAFSDLVEFGDRNRVSAMLLRVASGVIDADSIVHQIAPDHGGRFATTTAAVVRDSSANPLYLFIQCQDITDRLSAEESLRQ